MVVLADRSFDAGTHGVRWDGRDARGVRARSGLFFLRLDTPDGADARKLTLIP